MDQGEVDYGVVSKVSMDFLERFLLPWNWVRIRVHCSRHEFCLQSSVMEEAGTRVVFQSMLGYFVIFRIAEHSKSADVLLNRLKTMISDNSSFVMWSWGELNSIYSVLLCWRIAFRNG